MEERGTLCADVTLAATRAAVSLRSTGREGPSLGRTASRLGWADAHGPHRAITREGLLRLVRMGLMVDMDLSCEPLFTMHGRARLPAAAGALMPRPHLSR